MAPAARLLALGGAVALAGCSTKPLNLPAGQEAYAIFPPAETQTQARDFIIGPSDAVSVIVFNEPEVSVPQVRIDVAGNLNLPLIGKVRASGMTTEALARDIEVRLRTGNYLVSPRVTVNLIDSVSNRVTVDGEVTQPGIYPLTGPTTLLDAIAMSRGTTRVARTNEVAVFRVIDGQQRAAKFDLKAIRRGEAPNPSLQGNDVVVVGFDRLSGTWRDFLQAAPIFSLFITPFR